MDNKLANGDEHRGGHRSRAMSAPPAHQDSPPIRGQDRMQVDKKTYPTQPQNTQAANYSMEDLKARNATDGDLRPSLPRDKGNTSGQDIPAKPALSAVGDNMNNREIPTQTLLAHEARKVVDDASGQFKPINATVSRGRPSASDQSGYEAKGNKMDAKAPFISPLATYISPAAYLGEKAQTIAKRQSIPSLHITPPTPPGGNLAFQPQEHKMTQKILQKTAKCDYCNQRNTSVLLKCEQCPTAICRTCVERGKLDNDPKHGVRKEDRDSLDWDPSTGPRAAGFRTKKRSNETATEASNDKKGPVLSRQRIRTQSAAPSTQRKYNSNTAADRLDSDDEDVAQRKSTDKPDSQPRAKRPRGRPRKNPLPPDGDDEDDRQPPKRQRPHSVATPGIASSARSTAPTEDEITANMFRSTEQDALGPLNRAVVPQHQVAQPGARGNTWSSEAERRTNALSMFDPDPTRLPAAQHPAAQVAPTTARAPVTFDAASFTLRPSPGYNSNCEASRPYSASQQYGPASYGEPPRPASTHPPPATRRFAEPGAIPRGTYPRPLYGSNIPGTWQPPLWPNYGKDWDKQDQSLAPAKSQNVGVNANGPTAASSSYGARNPYQGPEGDHTVHPRFDGPSGVLDPHPTARGRHEQVLQSLPTRSTARFVPDDFFRLREPGSPPPAPPYHPAAASSLPVRERGPERPRMRDHTHREYHGGFEEHDADVRAASAALVGIRSGHRAQSNSKGYATKATQTD